MFHIDLQFIQFQKYVINWKNQVSQKLFEELDSLGKYTAKKTFGLTNYEQCVHKFETAVTVKDEQKSERPFIVIDDISVI